MAEHNSMGRYAGVEVHRVDSGVNGNPRYVVHYLDMLPHVPFNVSIRRSGEYFRVRQEIEFDIVKRALFGRAYRGAWMGGGIVFSTYENLDSYIEQARARVYVEFARENFID